MSTRRQYNPKQKAEAIKRHLVDKVAVSQICDEMQLQPSLFYHWLRGAFDNLQQVFDKPQGREVNERRQLEDKIAALEQRLARKDAVIAEISEEHIALKKELGEP